MRRSSSIPLAPLALLALLGLFAGQAGGLAQETNGYHEFTGKSGQKLLAKLISVSADRRQMRFVRQDGQEFETPIILFSLDDQQYVKEWLDQAPGPAGAELAMAAAPAAGGGVDYRLDLAVTKTAGETRRQRERSYTYESKDTVYRIALRNLSRETLERARLEYAVVWDDAVIIYRNSEGSWDYTTNSEGSERLRVKMGGAEEVSGIRYNGEAVAQTVPVAVDRVLFGSSEVYREDSILGVKVRVVGPDGAVFQEAHSGVAALAAMSWESIEALPEPRKMRGE
jgi:hypothetical protein